MLAVMGVAMAGLLAPPSRAGAGEMPQTDTRPTYVHRLSLFSLDGKVIQTGDANPAPYSPLATCGKCHAYESIGVGWHFNAARAEVPAGRPGEPWIFVDRPTGTQIPLSSRHWPGTRKPQELGQTQRAFTPGAGPLEIDCMLCHSADPAYDPGEQARQIGQQSLPWAPSAGMGLARAKIVPGSKPTMAYDKSKFDQDDRVLFNISRGASDDRCTYCHATVDAVQPASRRWHNDADVHLKAGLSCSDCHRSGPGHSIVRGYDGEASHYARAEVATLSCRGCHMDPGRGGASQPKHAGLPAVHLEKLTCTACHAGPQPEGTPRVVRTSMAHGLGLATRDRTPGRGPIIVAPVFLRQEDGRIAPHKMVWPAFWGRLSGEAVTPIPPEQVLQAAGEILTPKTSPATAEVEADAGPSAEQVTQTLAALKDQGADGQPVYVANGKLFSLAGDGTLSAVDHPAGKPYSWAIGHDVRPAREALGSRGCTECHRADSPIFFGQVSAMGPTAIGQSQGKPMLEFQGLCPDLQQAWALSFVFRPIFKIVGLAASGLLSATLLTYGFVGLRGLARRLNRKRPLAAGQSAGRAGPRMGVWEKLVYGTTVVSFLVLAGTGFYPVVVHGARLGGFLLMAHTVIGGVFAVALTALVLTWAKSGRFGRGFGRLDEWRKAFFWLLAAAGLVSMLSMFLSMTSLLGAEGMETLTQVHRWDGVLLIVAMTGHSYLRWRIRRGGRRD